VSAETRCNVCSQHHTAFFHTAFRHKPYDFFTLSQALAKELHVQFQLDDTWQPPALPPIAPENSVNPPPPPPRPPSPKFPIAESRIIRMVPIYSSSLSTYFLPTVRI
jgi:hypothetical protein